MFRKTFTGTLVAASLTAGALMTIPAASAAPTYIGTNSPSTVGTIPSNAHVVMSENGSGLATWLRVVSGNEVVQASYFSNGAWSAPANVSAINAEVAYPNAAINDKGVAVASWQQKDDNDHYQVRINRFISGAFGASKQISNGASYTATNEMDVAVDGTGKFWAAYQVTDNNALNRVRVVNEDGKGNPPTQYSNMGDDSAFLPDLAANAEGDALVAWYNAGDGSSSIDVRRFDAATKLWTATKSVSTTGQYKLEAETALNDNGVATVGYVKRDLDEDFRASVARVKADGTITGSTFVSPAGVTTDHISLDQNDSGAAVLAWNQASTEVGYKTRAYETAGWATGSAVNAALTGTTHPKAAISDTGAYVLGWVNGGDLHSAYRGVPAVLPFVKYDSDAIDFNVNETSAGIDNQGNAVVGGVYDLADPTEGALLVKFVDAAGPTSSVAGVTTNALKKNLHLTWSATDRFSDVTLYDVKVKTTKWNSTSGEYTSLLTGTPETSYDFATTPGRTYCFEVRARDTHANYGAFTAPKCTTTPVDDGVLTAAGGFTRVKSTSHYNGTYSKATAKGATLKLTQVKASRLALVVSKVASGGKVAVYFQGNKLGTYSLKGSSYQQVVPVKTFGAVEGGTVVIKVISETGKLVRIDGLIVAK